MISIEKTFLTLALLFGLIIALITPPFQVADEYQHFGYAYAISTGKLSGYQVDIPQSVHNLMSETRFLPFDSEAKVPYSKLLKYVYTPLAEGGVSNFSYQTQAKLNPILYMPGALSINISKWLGMNVYDLFYFGRIFQLLLWIIIGYQTLKYLPRFKWLFLLLLLSPMSLSLAASYSADALTNAVSFFWISLCLYFSFTKKKEINKNSKFVLFLTAACLMFIKPPYQILIFLCFIIPKEKIYKKSNYKRNTTFLFLFCMCLFSFPAFYLFANDISTTNTHSEIDLHDQFLYFLSFPLILPKIILNFLKYAGGYLVQSYIGVLGWIDTYLPNYIYSIYPVIVFSTLFLDQKKKQFLKSSQRVITLGVFFLTFLAIYLTLYLTYTPVRSQEVVGMQGRYLIPIIPVLVISLYSKQFSLKRSYTKLNQIVVTTYLVLTLSITVRSLILRFYL